MKLCIIAALSQNRVIGRNGTLPWHIPEDLQRFKLQTLGNTVVMGRKTFESLGSPLPQRRNIVISSHPLSTAETFPTLQAALAVLQNEDTIFVIGGERLFHEALPIADELRLTLVHATVEGDAFFPEYEDFVEKNFVIVKIQQNSMFDVVHYMRKIN